MATIEPLNSVMTYQAQTAAKPQAQAVTPVNTEVPEDGQTVNVDETTASVARPQPKEEKGSGSDGTGSQQQAANARQTQQQQAVNGKQAQQQQAAPVKQVQQQQTGNIRQNQQQSEQLKKAIAEMNKRINNSNEEAVFGVHEDTNRIMIKIMDKETKEVIKEFPPEKTLDMIARIWEMAGILVDEKM